MRSIASIDSGAAYPHVTQRIQTDCSPKLPLDKVTLRGFGQRFEKS